MERFVNKGRLATRKGVRRMLKKYSQLIKDAKKGEEIRMALTEGFESVDKVVKLLLGIQIIQGVALLISGIIAIKQ